MLHNCAKDPYKLAVNMASYTASNILIVLLVTAGAALAANVLDPLLQSIRNDKCKNTQELLTQQFNIKNMVADYNRTKNWKELRSKLSDVLDHSSPAYHQLMAVSESEAYAPWQIGYDGHRELTAVLVHAGRGINMVDGSADNLLHGAVAGGQLPLVEELLDAGAGIESRNSWGNAPLALACKYRRLEVARYLWRRGADVDGINYDERWAGLARAADEGYLEIARFMVEEASANTTLRDREGLTPLELARRKGHNDVVEYLLQFPH